MCRLLVLALIPRCVPCFVLYCTCVSLCSCAGCHSSSALQGSQWRINTMTEDLMADSLGQHWARTHKPTVRRSRSRPKNHPAQNRTVHRPPRGWGRSNRGPGLVATARPPGARNKGPALERWGRRSSFVRGAPRKRGR